MKKVLVLSLVFLIIFSGTVIAKNSEEERKTVFREFAWGDTVEFLKEEYEFEFVRLKDEETDDLYDIDYGLNFYRRSNENHQLGEYGLDSIIYSFFQNELIQIRIEVKHSVRKEAIFDMLVARYGDDYNKKSKIFGSDAYKWTEKDTDIYLIYDENMFTGRTKDFRINFISNSKMSKLKVWQKEQQEKHAEEQAKDW